MGRLRRARGRNRKEGGRRRRRRRTFRYAVCCEEVWCSFVCGARVLAGLLPSPIELFGDGEDASEGREEGRGGRKRRRRRRHASLTPSLQVTHPDIARRAVQTHRSIRSAIDRDRLHSTGCDWHRGSLALAHGARARDRSGEGDDGARLIAPAVAPRRRRRRPLGRRGKQQRTRKKLGAQRLIEMDANMRCRNHTS